MGAKTMKALIRWLARKAVTAEWKAQGRTVRYADARKITDASNIYLLTHKDQLMKHPAVVQYRERRRLKLARKAVIAEIRDKGRKVNSIEPSELKKLIESYLEEHPEENVFGTIVCLLTMCRT
jgi:hypothetical protein